MVHTIYHLPFRLQDKTTSAPKSVCQERSRKGPPWEVFPVAAVLRSALPTYTICSLGKHKYYSPWHSLPCSGFQKVERSSEVTSCSATTSPTHLLSQSWPHPSRPSPSTHRSAQCSSPSNWRRCPISSALRQPCHCWVFRSCWLVWKAPCYCHHCSSPHLHLHINSTIIPGLSFQCFTAVH